MMKGNNTHSFEFKHKIEFNINKKKTLKNHNYYIIIRYCLKTLKLYNFHIFIVAIWVR
jgi:hypothetical protein